MRHWILVAGLAAGGAAAAGERVDICYNYGCLTQAGVEFSEARLAAVRQALRAAPDAQGERQALALAVGRLYQWAGEQTPIWRDRGEDYPDAEAEGRMDCIDHATSTSRLLRMIERRGWLRFHRVLEPVRRTRALLFQHFSAAVEEIAPAAPAQWTRVRAPPPAWCGDCVVFAADEQFVLVAGEPAPPPRFVIDSWFHDHGRPAVVMPLEVWMDGAYPDE